MTRRRRTVLARSLTPLSVALMCAGVSSCTSPDKDRALDRPSTVIISSCCGDEVLSPIHDMGAKFLVFLSLMTIDQHGELQGRLARSWSHSPDHREWTYHLRTDVRWHDGVPVTAHDVAFTIDLMESFGDLDYGGGAFEQATVHDDSTITLRLGHARSQHQIWMVFYPRHLLEGLDRDRLGEWDFWKRPVGNGPYRFVRLEPETMMEFAANPDFYDGKPKIDRVILKFSLGAGITELLSGNVDAAEVPPVSLPAVTRDPRFQIYFQTNPYSGMAIYWKSNHPLFHDVRIRRALTQAIDRHVLHRLLNLPEDVPVFDGPFTPDQFRRGELAAVPYDPEDARAMLEAAGWSDSDGDGIRERAGRPFHFTAFIRTVSGENSPSNLASATFVQSELLKVGVRMDLEPLDPTVVWQRLRDGDFEAVLYWTRFWEASWLQRFRLGHGEPIGYSNPRLVELLDQATETWDSQEQNRIYRELGDILRRDLPFTILHPWVGFMAAHRRLRGIQGLPWGGDPVMRHMDKLWLEEAR
jgi:peptide/nickel transport system substrate-binding protein